MELGYTQEQIYGAWIYYKTQGRKYNSFAILLWEKCKLIRDILPLLEMKEKPLDEIFYGKDFRPNKIFSPPRQTVMDFLKRDDEHKES